MIDPRFDCQISTAGTKCYRHLENGLKRGELLSKYVLGEISYKELRTKALRLKFLFSEADYLDYIN